MLTFSGGMPSSRSATIVTTAKASLISKRSTWSIVQSSFSRSCGLRDRRGRKPFGLLAPGGAHHDHGGWFEFRGVGIRRGDATRSAAAPSLMLEAFPAVIVPSGSNAGFSARSLASSNLAGPSSAETRGRLPLIDDLDRHDLGRRKTPSAIAWRARVWLRTAKSSCSRRLNRYFSAQASPQRSHVLAAVDVPEAVLDHGVEELSVAEPIAVARLGEQVRVHGSCFPCRRPRSAMRRRRGSPGRRA